MSATRSRSRAAHSTSRAVAACPWLDPGEQGEKLDVEDFPAFLLWRLANASRSAPTRKYLERFNVSVPEWRLLALISGHSSLAFGEVSARSAMDKGQVSRTLQMISARGLVRVAAAPAPRTKGRATAAATRVAVSVTPKGAALYRRIVPAARSQQMRLLNLMSAKERQVFYAVSRRILAALPEAGEAGD